MIAYSASNFLTVPAISESLAGRVDITTLWPLSQGEVTGGPDEFVDRGVRGIGQLLGHRGPTPELDHYFDLLCRGGYPGVQGFSERARRRWFANLLGKQTAALRRPTDPAAGPLFETFSVNELVKQLTWCDTPARLFHFRDRDGTEVDTIIEATDGRVIRKTSRACARSRRRRPGRE